MYVLYLDDAGSVKNRNENHFVLAGIALHESQINRLQDSLEDLVRTLGHPRPETLELHGNVILNGRGWWRGVPSERRRGIITSGLNTAFGLAPRRWRLFGEVVDRRDPFPKEPVEYAFERIASRFNRFLGTLNDERNPQKGLIILDKSTQETQLQAIASDVRAFSRRWGTTIDLVEVPLFVDSRATRCVQYADLVAYAMWRNYEQSDDRFFKLIDGMV